MKTEKRLKRNTQAPTLSLERTLYIAALDRYLGIRGLLCDVTDKREGTPYTFDFYEPDDKTLVKIVTRFEEMERYAPYVDHPNAILIADLEQMLDSIGSPVSFDCLCQAPESLKQIFERQEVLVYWNDTLWMPGIGNTHWIPITPIEAQAAMAHPDEEENWEED